jgi:hypothetical protein
MNRKDQINSRSRGRLKQIASKKITTSFIFPIAEFEQVFGLELWGMGLPEDEITARQKINRERWEQLRLSVLNNGNKQVRALNAEIDLHTVEFVGYRMSLKPIGENEDG